MCVLVVTLDASVARWAAQPIEIGPGHRFTPMVLGPEQVPEVSDVPEAIAAPERAVLSAMAHGKSSDVSKAVRIAKAALEGARSLDIDRRKLYADMVIDSLSEAACKEVQAMAMNRFNYEYRSDYARHYVAEGLAQGLAEARAEGSTRVLKQLTLRFGALGENVESRVRAAPVEELDEIAERLLTAETLEEALGSNPPTSKSCGSPDGS